jgi:hypothetical protein
LYEGGERYTIHVYTVGGGEEYTLHVCFADGGQRYTLHVHTDYGVSCMSIVHTASEGKGYTLHVYCTLLEVEGDTLCTSTLRAAERDTPSRPHVGGKKGYTLTSTLLVVERDTLLRPHCWWWKGIQPYVHTAVNAGKS